MTTKNERETEPIPSFKDLASSEPSLRRKNLQQIITHLEHRSSSNYLTHTQALQLWRGFYVALYMHDSKNQLSVQTLIATLADTFRIIRAKDVQVQQAAYDADSNLGNGTTQSNGSSNATSMDRSKSETEDDEDFAGFDDEAPSSTPDTTTEKSWLSTYSSAFWETIAREWSSIDQWRVDKYLLLTRFVLREILKISLSSYLGIESPSTNNDHDNDDDDENEPESPPANTKKRKSTSSTTTKPNNTTSPRPHPTKKPKPSSSSTSPSTTTPEANTATTQLTLLEQYPLNPSDPKLPNGLRLHILDIYVEEFTTALKSATSSDLDSDTKTALRDMFCAPIRHVATEGLARHVRTKAKEVLVEFDESFLIK